MEVKLKTARDKLENLTITIKNDGGSAKKKKNDKSENPLLERLRSITIFKTSFLVLITIPL
jgi:hypothetical protein